MAGGGWSRRKVGTCACASSHRDTLPSCIQPLSTKKCFLAAYWHCVSRPASYYSLAIPSSSSGSRPLCAHQQHCCPSEDPPRATLHSGNSAPRSRHVDSLIFGQLCGPILVRWLSKATARRGKDSEEFICCAGERGEPGETITLSIESLLRCEQIPAHPYPPALAVLHRRLH